MSTGADRYTRDEVYGMKTTAALSPNNSLAVLKQAKSATAMNQEWRGAIIGQRKNGYEFHQDMILRPMRVVHGTKVNVRFANGVRFDFGV